MMRRWRRLARSPRSIALRQTVPVSDGWGYERGTPIDRFYIERFLGANRADIQGRVLEVKDSAYTDRFGTGVTQRGILDIDPTNARATVVADLAAADSLADACFDCFVLTQTLHLIYDVTAALGHAHRILAPGGVLLVTGPGISRVGRGVGVEGDFWRFTAASLSRLLRGTFAPETVAVETFGNVLSGMAFLTGMAQEDLRHRELEETDPYFPVVVTGRAVKF